MDAKEGRWQARTHTLQMTAAKVRTTNQVDGYVEFPSPSLEKISIMKYRVGMKVDRDDLHHLIFNYRVRVVWDREEPLESIAGKDGYKSKEKRRKEMKDPSTHVPYNNLKPWASQTLSLHLLRCTRSGGKGKTRKNESRTKSIS